MIRFIATFIFCLLLYPGQLMARIMPGIQFCHLSWGDLVTRAKMENKPIFIDFYTQWCGPCMNMAETVFTLPEVGAFYNEHFVCAKIDAESLEGKELARKYQVKVYPTYVFVDANSEEPIHRSSSTQTAETFIFTGESALNAQLRSFYLEKAYAGGDRSRQLLMNYIRYEYSIHKGNLVNQAFDELLKGGAKLTDADVWRLFVDCISGVTPALKQVSANYSTFCRLFTKTVVDEKLDKETTYGDYEEIASLCDFPEKKFNLKMILVNSLIRNRKYLDSESIIDGLIADSTVNQRKLMHQLIFIVRQAAYDKEMPEYWFGKCLEYARYIAYNWAQRNDATVHQLYASLLEEAIKRNSNPSVIEKKIIEEPPIGIKTYSMRSPALKPKPTKKK